MVLIPAPILMECHSLSKTVTKAAFGGTCAIYPIPNSALLLLSTLTLVSLDRWWIFPTLSPLLPLISIYFSWDLNLAASKKTEPQHNNLNKYGISLLQNNKS